MKTSRGAVIAGLLVFFVLTAAFSAVYGRASAAKTRQPVAFNHRKHVKDLELACSTCHQFYEKETFSGLPDADVCGACHSEPQGKGAEEARLVKILKTGGSPQWVPLFRQPAHLFYSHRRHVVVAKIQCQVCHGSIAETTTPPETVRKLKMQDCLDCHAREGVSTDCTACHR